MLCSTLCVLLCLQLIYIRYTEINKSDLNVKILNYLPSSLISPPEVSLLSASPPAFLKKTRKVEKGTEVLGRVDNEARVMSKAFRCVTRR